MMEKLYYSSERNVQILLGLLKANGIKKVVASPGSTNIPLVLSMQNDGGFEMYSCVDERSAAYMAVGLSQESGEPVVLTCTGATASRNYFSGLTEAYYRHLPILAVTSTRPLSHIGHLCAQVIDRTKISNDIANLSVFAPLVRCNDDEWDCQMKLNQAMIALRANGGGPVHINLETESSFDFSVKELKGVRNIRYITPYDDFPEISGGKTAIFVGSHKPFSDNETKAIDTFCAKYNGIVLCDHTSNYHGRYRVLGALMGGQKKYLSVAANADLMIGIGDITGSYEMAMLGPKAKKFWRVAEDGVLRDMTHSLSAMFYMREIDFFEKYASMKSSESDGSFYANCVEDYASLIEKIPSDLPFSNIWVAKEFSPRIPDNSVIQYSILNSLRSWSFFEVPNSVNGFGCTGGFGIDGGISAMMGASLCNKNKLYFGIAGDLSFFYDMNVLGNHHIGNNVRLLIVNNGKGMEFRNFIHPASKYDNDVVDPYISAGGHFGNKSINLVKHFAEDLGYRYMSATSKEELKKVEDEFLSPVIGDKPIILEVFTEQNDENKALYTMLNLKVSTDKLIVNAAREVIESVAGKEGFEKVKNIIRGR